MNTYNTTTKDRILIIAGPTAAGKTAAAIQLAQKLGGEIISADSRQVYRGLDIGSAKASAVERALVRHHLLDCVEPTERFDAARFVDAAREIIAHIIQRKHVPIIAGGTGLYLRALCGGLAKAPAKDASLRTELEAYAEQQGNAALHARLAKVDVDSAMRIPQGDRLRTIRALEVFELTGISLSEHHRRHAFADRPYRDCWLVVDRPKQELEERIAQRSQAMFAAGLVDEAIGLRQRFGDIELLQTMGYAEALALADKKISKAKAIEQTRLRTRRYAKRQRTWFKREPVFYWGIGAEVQDFISAFNNFVTT